MQYEYTSDMLMDLEQDFYTAADIAVLLDVGRATVYRWMKRGLIVSINAGPRRLRVSRRALIQFLNQRNGVPHDARVEAKEEVIRRFGIEVRKDTQYGTRSKLHYRNGEEFPYHGDPATEDEWRLFEALVLLQHECLTRSLENGNEEDISNFKRKGTSSQ